MCAIIGALIWDKTPLGVSAANRVIDHIGSASFARGRDGWGYTVREAPHSGQPCGFERKSVRRATDWEHGGEYFDPFRLLEAGVLIGNFRAEPTTEYVAHKRYEDQQPYRCGKWSIVHNGTVANDADLRTNLLKTRIDSAAIAEVLAGLTYREELGGNTVEALSCTFRDTVAVLKGSYAILAAHDDHPGLVFAACNYRPIWFAQGDRSVFFASSRSYFPDALVPQMLEPYSCWAFTSDGRQRLDTAPAQGARALVVCSGGMDSVVAAVAAQRQGYAVELVHFRYGSRAEGPEVQAIHAVAKHLDVRLHVLPMAIYDPADSPLLRHDSDIAGGEAGAEFAHEWVPARNLVMLALATAFAEAKGFDTIVLGNNLEEAGAYPDNEPEFIDRFNDLLPFAVGDGKRVRVIMPVGNLMKHEIVSLGHELGAPLHLTWSCYRAGPLHCGTCGPCFMRRTAFDINGLPEVIEYQSKGTGA